MGPWQHLGHGRSNIVSVAEENSHFTITYEYHRISHLPAKCIYPAQFKGRCLRLKLFKSLQAWERRG